MRWVGKLADGCLYQYISVLAGKSIFIHMYEQEAVNLPTTRYKGEEGCRGAEGLKGRWG